MFEIKDKVIFTGYSEELDDDDVVFVKGDVLLINNVEPDGKYEAICIEGDRKGQSSYVFSDEVKLITQDVEDVEEPEEVEEPAEEPEEPKSKEDKVLELTPEQIVANALKAIEGSRKNEFTFAESASVIREHDLHEQFGEEFRGSNGFKKFCEIYLDYDYQKTLRLVSIYRNCVEADVKTSELEGITYSKAYHISRIITKENKEELLEYARTHSVREVKAYVASQNTLEDHEELEAKASQGGSSCSITFKFTEDQYKHVIDGLDGVKNNVPDAGDNLNLVFMYVLNEFLNHYNVEIPEKQTLEHFNLKMGTNLTMQDINSARERLEEI